MHLGAYLSIDRKVFVIRCTARHDDRSEEYASQAFASTLATELPAIIINSRQIVLVGQSFGDSSVLRTALMASTETTPA
ncbi:hypothetical protein [Corynebacterium propinquum]|uniref:hypothetical protein n=1 Tax=Corynebacterium propinquum TaxID=43769 RepID=UPI00036383B3|nr:hypothetical protein [Corynebacterium propinquum]MCT1817569.1 hypothetical protein [Corynebacterium propinquum]MDK4233808.1 hypothetical protein [Corynebacterium propinquum]MDK4258657.1 hypothetical protein [Corynebacterium propinquum]MDK4283093.1 hypothetical protein [Corynebacterium propinquum]MDK4292262.1 hypothetical protein [Corynebacterium propinquum]